MDLGKPIGKGATADVYAWGSGQVLKLFKKKFPKSHIINEVNAAKLAYKNGIPTPKVEWELQEINNLFGICFERIDGISLVNYVIANPNLQSETVTKFTELHSEIHKIKCEGLLSQRRLLQDKLAIVDQKKKYPYGRIINKLDSLPEGNQLCHGDFTAENIIVKDKKLFITDWSLGCCGNPIADFARTIIVHKMANISISNYIEGYLAINNLKWNDIEPWLPTVAVSLVYDLPKLKRKLINLSLCRRL